MAYGIRSISVLVCNILVGPVNSIEVFNTRESYYNTSKHGVLLCSELSNNTSICTTSIVIQYLLVVIQYIALPGRD